MENFYKKWFWPLVLPALIVFLLVVLAPFVVGIVYSFTNWKGSFFANTTGIADASGSLRTTWYNSFVGWRNYTNAFQNEQFIKALTYTVGYTVIATITVNLFGLLFALLIANIKKGKGLFRGAFFLPNLLGGLALGFIWSMIFDVVFTQILFGSTDGSSLINWPFFQNMLQHRWTSMFALVIVGTWQTAGYMMIIYINGLNNIPKSLMEASEIDGANAWQKFRHITIPNLMPSFTICFFLTLANSFKLLDQNVALNGGDKGFRTLATQIVSGTADSNPPDYGQIQAQAVIFFILVAVITLTQVAITSRKEVN